MEGLELLDEFIRKTTVAATGKNQSRLGIKNTLKQHNIAGQEYSLPSNRIPVTRSQFKEYQDLLVEKVDRLQGLIPGPEGQYIAMLHGLLLPREG